MPQVKYWFWPFWFDLVMCNLYEKKYALEVIEKHRTPKPFHAITYITDL
jgi:hypothetical protein